MKKTCILLLGALAALTSCGMIAQSASSDDGSRFQDGIYSSSPTFRSKEERAAAKSETDELIARTKESPIYLFGDKKDTIMIPENFSAKIQYDQKVGGTVVTVGENPYDWRWDLENNYGYWYGPYSIGSSWYWSRHYSPYWSSWSYSPWRYYGYYDPWYYDPWYYGGYWGGFHDPWYYGGYWGGMYAGYWGWHDPWHHYHHHGGWYDPHYHHHGGPSHIAGGSGGHRDTYHGLRARTEAGGAFTSSHAVTSKPSSSVRATSGTIRGGMSVGNRTGRSSVSRSGSTSRSSVSGSSSASRGTGGRTVTAPTYRRPATGTGSSAGYSRGSSSTPARSSGSSSYDRGSSYSSGSSSYSRGSSYDYSRSSSSGSSSYSRGSSSSGSSYSRGSSYSSGSSSGGYSRGGSSSGGGYRR